MAFQTGSAIDLDDLFTKLSTFLVANGWTQDEGVSAQTPSFNKNSIFVQFRYTASSPTNVGVYQSTAWDGVGTNPGLHTGDSGNGWASSGAANDSSISGERCISGIGDGPFTNYWFFEQDASPSYVHVVVEIAVNKFRHFGFGEIDKFGTWTGGEYVYGHYQSGNNAAVASTASCLLDGFFRTTGATNSRRAATMRALGLPGEGGTSVWGQVWGHTTPVPDDTAANAKISLAGGFRGGPVAPHFGIMRGAAIDGLVPMYQIPVFYVDVGNSHAYYLGTQPDVRGLNIRNFSARSTVNIGGDIWYIFPMAIRTESTSLALSSGYSGIAYKQVVA